MYHAVTENGIKLEDVIMEAYLGRKLRKNEQVVFINGNGLDCRKKNLKVITVNKKETAD